MRGLVVIATLILHVVILLPLALSPPREPPSAPREQIVLVPLELSEALPRRTVGHLRPSVDPDTPRQPPAPPQPREAAPSPAAPAVPTAPSSAAPPPDADVGPAAVADPWNGRRPVTLALPCPPPPGDRIAARLCQVGPSSGEGSDPYVDAGARRLNRSEQARENGFERQRRANEAWRDYTRGEGPYPGLRALRDR